MEDVARVLSCASAAAISAQEGARQTWSSLVWFIQPMALPSGENAKSELSLPWPSKVNTSCQLCVSHNFTASLLPLPMASRWPSGEKATE